MSTDLDPSRCLGERTASIRATAVVLCLIGAPGISTAQPPEPLYPKWSANVGLGYARLSLDPNPPRDLRLHENHRDDFFLVGSPGETDLERFVVQALEVQLGFAYRLGLRNLALTFDYVPHLLGQVDGRLEQRQANDPRPPANSSFVYSTVRDVGVRHAVRTGLALAAQLSRDDDWWFEVRMSVDAGRHDATFEKGWSRFGRDEPAITSTARGIEISPGGKVSIRTSRWSAFGGASYTHITYSHELAHLEDHSAKGWGISLGASVRP